MFNLPIFEKLSKSQNILIAGAGGGFDVFSGLPLYFALKRRGKTVHLANWTFSEISPGPGYPEMLAEHLVAVKASSKGDYYFPERYLCQWFESRGEQVTVYCFKPCGTQELKKCYELLVNKLSIDTILLVDGGTDSLLRGEEATLGTPLEDMSSIAAVDQLEVESKFLACIGFGIDSFHGVCHAHVLGSIAEQSMKGGYLGAISLLNSMPEVKMLQKAARYVFRCMPAATSIVISSIISALDGNFGDYHATERTAGSKLFINPLMCIYWFFDLHSVAESIVYINDVKVTKNLDETWRAISGFRRRSPARPWQHLPI